MALKSYKELRNIDVTPYCDKRDGATYLNWAKCMDLLHENGAEIVYWNPIVNENGSSLISSNKTFTDKNGTTNNCYETKIQVKIDDNEFEFQHPVMNGGNPVKDNSMTQARLWAAQCRAFVKAVAIHTGLGFDLWLEEEKKTEKELAKVNMYHSISKVREQVYEAISAINKSGMTLSEIATTINIAEEDINYYMNFYKKLEIFEGNINKLYNKKLKDGDIK